MIINEKFKQAFQCTNRYVVLLGGAGSGKSYLATQKIVSRLVSESGHKILVIRKYGTTLKNSVYDLFREVIYTEDLQSIFNFTVAPLEITCTLNGNRIIFIGLDDPEKIKSISSVTGMFCDEATELALKDFKQIDLRLRGESKNYKQIILCLNPIDKRHWINQEFFIDRNYNDMYSFKSNYLDNQFIDDEYAQALYNNGRRDENYKRVYMDGDWGSLNDNTIFTNWKVEEISNDLNTYDTCYAGVDFGYNHASVGLIISIKGDDLFVLDEQYFKRMTRDRFMTILKEQWPYWLTMTADSAEPAAIREMRDIGLRVTATKKGRKSVFDGLDYLKRKNIIIHPSCTNLIREIQSYSYKFDDRTNTVFDEPIAVDDDCIAALRYSVEPLRLQTSVRATVSLY